MTLFVRRSLAKSAIFSFQFADELDECLSSAKIRLRNSCGIRPLVLVMQAAENRLGNEPRCLRAILADCLLVRPGTFVDDLSQPVCIPDVHCFHARNITAPKLAGIDQFLTNSQVF